MTTADFARLVRLTADRYARAPIHELRKAYRTEVAAMRAGITMAQIDAAIAAQAGIFAALEDRIGTEAATTEAEAIEAEWPAPDAVGA